MNIEDAYEIHDLVRKGAKTYAPAHLLVPYREICRRQDRPRGLMDELIFRLRLVIMAEGGVDAAAKRLLVTRSTVFRWMRKKCHPGDAATIQRIDVAFNTSLKKLSLGELRGRRDLRRSVAAHLKAIGAQDIATDFGTVTIVPTKFPEYGTENYERTTVNQSVEPASSGQPKSDDNSEPSASV